MRAAIIHMGLVTNVIEVSSLSSYAGAVKCSDDVSIGYSYNVNTKKFTAPTIQQSIIPPLTQDEYTTGIQWFLDSTAVAYGFVDILDAWLFSIAEVGSYKQTEGAAFSAWRSKVWEATYAALAINPSISIITLINELPALGLAAPQ